MQITPELHVFIKMFKVNIAPSWVSLGPLQAGPHFQMVMSAACFVGRAMPPVLVLWVPDAWVLPLPKPPSSAVFKQLKDL